MKPSSLPLRAVPAAAVLSLLSAAPAAAATHAGPAAEQTPLNLGQSDASTSHLAGTSFGHMLLALVIVIALICVLAYVMRRLKSGRGPRAYGSGLANVASLPLGTGRSLHLVRAGGEYVLIGVAEQGVVPIRRYTEEEAREIGLLDEPGDDASGGPPGPPPGPVAAVMRQTLTRALDQLRSRTVRG
jgi:flagellar protein FliO/FliZ